MSQNIEKRFSDGSPKKIYENLGRVYVSDNNLQSENETYGTFSWSTLPNGRQGFVEEIHIPTFRRLGGTQEK